MSAHHIAAHMAAHVVALRDAGFPTDTVDALYTLPLHMHDAVVRWMVLAEPHPAMMGTFLRAVLRDQLVESLAAADDDNARAIREWGRFLHNHLPTEAWGTWDRMVSWYYRHHPDQSAKRDAAVHEATARAIIAGR